MPPITPGSGPVLRRVVGTGPDTFARVSARAGALRRLDRVDVLAPLRVTMDGDGSVVVELPPVQGTDLAELARLRPPLAAGECAWLGANVAAALQAMHRAGLAHGDIAPANVLVRDDGVTLIDTISGCLDEERGTAGFQAPERSAGATVPGDTCSLGMLLRWCADDACRVPLEEWTAPMVLPDSTARPTAGVVADALSSSASAVPVAVPASDVVSATRARILERTERAAPAGPARHRSYAVRAVIVAGVLAVSAAVVTMVPPLVDAALAGESATEAADPEGDPPRAVASAHDESPDRAAVRLTRARVEALAAGDPQALRALAAPGALAARIEELAARVESGAVRYEGVSVEVLDADVVGSDSDRAQVSVAYRVGDHTVIEDGVATHIDAFDQSVTMVLVRAPGAEGAEEWLVESIMPNG